MKFCLRLFGSITPFLFLCISLHAQSTNEVKGSVMDEKQNLLEGVTVSEKGTTNTVVTKPDGSFTIKIKTTSSFVLVFTDVSHEKIEMKFTARPDGIVNVRMKSKNSNLDEVVVIAYGKTTRRLASNSVVSLSAKQFGDLPVASPAEAMIGMVAGASIVTPSGEPGQNPYIRIRGLGSIGAGNDPLFVVDGYPLNNTDNFYNIAPADIQSIQILKDAAACAIYGSRGGNGIILVTTKRGIAGKTRFSATIYHGITGVTKKIKLLDADQYIDYTKDAYTNAGKAFPGIFSDTSQWANTNWQDQIFRTANQDNYQLSTSGGSDASKFYISGNYFNQAGVVPGTSFKRYMLRANYDAKLSSKLKLGMTFAPNFSTTHTMPVSGSFNSSTITNGGPANLGAVVTDALLMPAVIPVYKANGDYGELLNSFGNSFSIGGLYNPKATLDLYQDKTNAFRGMFISYLEYEIIHNLSFKTSLGGESIFSRRNYYVPATLANGSAPNANLSTPVLAGINAEQLNSNTYNWLWENTLNYGLTKGVHRFDALVGYGAQKNISEGSTVSGKASTYTSSAIDYVTAAGTILGTASYTASTLASVFGRVNYSYKSRYILSGALRTDGSSRFGANNRYATFPSLSAAWRVADESFMRKYSNIISELKVRSSYGVTGNNNIGDYSWQSYEQPSNYVLGSGTGTVNYGFAPNSLANNSLTWETNTQLDVSLELGLLHNRIYLTVETYERKTTNLLLNQNVPAVIGYATTILNNVGEVKNNGVDIQLQTVNIDRSNFRWTTNFNIFWNKNKVISLSSPSDQLLFDPVYGYTSAIRVVPGLPMGSFFGYKQIGVYKDAADVANSPVWGAGGSQPGDIKYADVNKQGVINSNDIIYLGNPYPKYTYGMQNNFAYKKWTFSLSIQGSVGGYILNGAERYIYTFDGLANARTNALNRWKSASDPGDGWTPRVVLNPSSSLTSFSNHELFDASFLRVKNLTIRYSLPGKLLGWGKIESASLYMMAQNLYTFQKYFGYNPEANLYGNTVTPTYGVDQGSYPLNRIVTFGANISF